MTPSIVAAAALAFVSCVGNFGIPAFLGIPANYLVLPTLIYQRLAGGGPAVLGDAAFLSVLIGIIAMAGIVAQEVDEPAARLPHQFDVALRRALRTRQMAAAGRRR